MTVLETRQDTPENEKQSRAISLKNILFATDFSATSESALPYATAISRRFGSTLHIAHVLSDTNLLLMTGGVDYVSTGTIYEDTHAQAQEKIQQITKRLGEIPYCTYVRHGLPWKNLSRIVVENAIDLLVVGTHGRTGLGKLLLGSVAEDILRHVPCPVLTVGPKVAGHAKLREFHGKGRELAAVELELRQILYATNFTDASVVVAPVAVALAGQFRAQLTLMHVIEQYAGWGNPHGPIEDGVQKLRALVAKDASLAYPPEFVIEFGTPSEVIVSAAAKREADLLVLGARPVDGTAHLPWSTVHRVVAHAACPVLTVPA
jgi:nucleotide-binding universal stress UspA family protein